MSAKRSSPPIDEDEFKLWLEHRSTRGFMAALASERDRLAVQWAGGVEMTKEDQIRAVIYGEICNLTWDDLCEIYRQRQQ